MTGFVQKHLQHPALVLISVIGFHCSMKASACAAVLVAVWAACNCVVPTVAQKITDVDILNFALNLEYLEAEFYSWAVFGKGLSTELRGGGEQSVGGMKANLTGNALEIATEIANDEINHVKFLRNALGASAIPQPRLNIGSSFVTAARAAFNDTKLKPNFSPYADNILFMHGAFIFEDVGVTAYKGAAALITTPAYLTAAAGILAVEAYHAGTVRSYLSQNAALPTPFGVNVSTVVEGIAALRVKLSGLPASTPDDFGIINKTTGGEINVPTDVNGIVFSRTPAQVVSIVTFGSTTGKGGFFPLGLNGNIKASLQSGQAVAIGDSTAAGMAAAPSGSSAAGPSGNAMSPSASEGSAAGAAGAPAAATSPTAGSSAASTTASISIAALLSASFFGGLHLAACLGTSCPSRPWKLRQDLLHGCDTGLRFFRR